MQILISNGSNQFHMGPLAAELAKRGKLLGIIASGWPTGFTRCLAKPFLKHAPVQRFFNRSEAIPVKLQHISTISEIVFQIGIRLRRISEHTEQRFSGLGFAWYSLYASKVLKRGNPSIYHYRACYGLGSVRTAKRMRVSAICDHSIAHPAVLQYMVENDGSWPEKPVPVTIIKSPLQRLMDRDIAQADWLLVNSHFVKETCVFAGYPAERIRVVYLGVDDKFFQTIPTLDEDQVKARVGGAILFAGGIQQRKGIATLAQAGLLLSDRVQFKLIGGAGAEIFALPGVDKWLESKSVHRVGIVPRGELARHMTEASIFVFPSYCEGSARVIFEAMACGCYIITTENSGSIVEDGIHGALVPVGDAAALAQAIQRALEKPLRVAEIGWQNSNLVKSRYRQSNYADNVIAVYQEILN